MLQNPSWRIEGDYFESCNCELLCPCLLSHAQARPTEGHCDVVLAIHVARGDCGGVDLTGLNVVQALTTPGPMAQGNGTLAVYVDDRASEAQRAALEAIFTGNAGGPPSLLAGMVSKRLPTKSAPINFSTTGKSFKLAIAGITDVTVEGVTGAGGQVVWLDNVGHPFSSRLAAAKATESKYSDHSLSFDNSGRNGHFSAISWVNS
ncbi:MAG TPA: DUF1326 domain-containing protein [Candidatus Binataceae bacterium]|nr:DUF1326 domain-containing protein [Candidatus Binataceae bacterium]